MNFEGCRDEAGIPNPWNLCNVGMVCMELRIHFCLSQQEPELYPGLVSVNEKLAWRGWWGILLDPRGGSSQQSPHGATSLSGHCPQQGELSRGQTPWNCNLPSLNLSVQQWQLFRNITMWIRGATAQIYGNVALAAIWEHLDLYLCANTLAVVATLGDFITNNNRKAKRSLKYC